MIWLPIIAVGAALFTDRDKPRDQYGVMSPSGIRGVSGFRDFTPDEISAYNREGAAQGLRGTSVAPEPSWG